MDNFPSQNQAIVMSSGVETKILCSSYSDRHFVVITQLHKVGTLIQAHTQKSLDGEGKTFSISTLLGRRDDPLLDVYARQIIQQISGYSDNPLLLAISLKSDGRTTEIFQDVLNRLLEISTWR